MYEGTVARGEIMQGAMHWGLEEVEMADDRDSWGARRESLVFGFEKVNEEYCGNKRESQERG